MVLMITAQRNPADVVSLKAAGMLDAEFRVGFRRLADGLACACECSTNADVVERVVRLVGRGVHVGQDVEFESHHALGLRTRGWFSSVEPYPFPVSIQWAVRNESIRRHITTERV